MTQLEDLLQQYLNSLIHRYEKWWEIDALTATIAARQATFSFEQKVQTEEKRTAEAESQQSQNSRTIQLPLIAGIQDYAKAEPVLVVGSPGVGKTSALLRCLVEYAKQELLKPESERRIPVLLRLKRYKSELATSNDRSGLLAMIQDVLEPELSLELAEIKKLLFQEKRLILLLDGLNEMSSDSIRTELISFQEKCARAKIPFICSTRELGSGDLSIKRKLVIQPPDPEEIDRFLRECIPTQSQKVEQLLNRDRRELSRTPFVLWMLYHVIQETGDVADTLGEAFRQFFQSFKGRLEAAPVTDDRRRAWDRWLRHLAFIMLSSLEPTDPGLVISEEDAEAALFEKFPPPHETPSLSELLKYHLLQQEKTEISFHHQLIQEYYAAEALVAQLKDLTEKKLKCNYLNYLKWTEPIALMLALLEDGEKALQIVQWALDVDLMLGARLAGEVKQELQRQSVKLIEQLEVDELLKIDLLGLSCSEKAISRLKTIIDEVGYIGNLSVRKAFAVSGALSGISSAQVIPLLFKLLEHPNSRVRADAIEALGYVGAKQSIFFEALRDPHYSVRYRAVYILGKIESEQAIFALHDAMRDSDPSVRWLAAVTLRDMGLEQATDALLDELEKISFSLHSELYTFNRNEIGKSLDDMLSGMAVLSSRAHSRSYCRVQTVYISDSADVEHALSIVNKALEDSDPNIRVDRLFAIKEYFKKKAKEEALPILVKALKDSDFDVRFNAASAMKELCDPQALKYLWWRQVEYSEEFNEKAISAIQNHCQFYNYEIYQQARKQSLKDHSSVEDYDEILQIVQAAGKEIERKPLSFGGMAEEALRDVFLVALNTKYPGQSTGETFNKKGKTDILIRVDNKNVFIGECKFWSGKKKLKETSDQLLRYATWRDDQLALLFFNRNKNFSAVLEQISEGIREHPNFICEKEHSEDCFFCLISHPDDPSRQLKLAVLAFDIPP